MRARRILPESISQPANAFRQTPAETAFVTDRQLTSHRAAVLREASGQDAHRDLDKGHVAVGEFVLVAVHGDHVTYDVETARGGLIDALRLPAISAEPALRLPEVPARGTRGCGDLVQRVPGLGTDSHRGVLRVS